MSDVARPGGELFHEALMAGLDLLEMAMAPPDLIDEREAVRARQRFEDLGLDPTSGAHLWQTLAIITCRAWAEDTERSTAEVVARLRNRLAGEA